MGSARSPRAPGPGRAARFAVLAFGLVVAAVILFAAETVFDLRARIGGEDPLIARWSRDGAFFIADGTDLVSNHPNMPPARFPAAPPSGELRVFLLGGSQAMGDPYVHGRRVVAGLSLDELNIANSGGVATWLQHYLERLHPDRSVRVVNAAMGDRNLSTVAAAFEEIADSAAPDLAIVLAGNNEIFQASFESAAARDRTLVELTENYSAQLHRIARTAARRRIATYLLTVPTNVRGWLPSYAHQPLAKAEIDRLLDLPHDAVPEHALGELRRAEHALFDFFTARALAAAGELRRSYQAYVTAKDRDFNLIRAHSEWNDLVRRSEGPYLHTLDLEEALRRHAVDATPGFDLFHDHCHMKLRTNVLVAKEIAEFHRRIAGLDAVDLPDPDLDERLRSQLASLYTIKQRKWERINELSTFEALGDRNQQNVAASFAAEKAALEAITRAIDTYESDLPVSDQKSP